MPMPMGPMPGSPPMRPPEGGKAPVPKAPEKAKMTRTIKVGDTTIEVPTNAGTNAQPATPSETP
jgi:hypothetical protein